MFRSTGPDRTHINTRHDTHTSHVCATHTMQREPPPFTRPPASERTGPARPRRPLAGGPPAPAPAARPLTPNGSAGCRRRGCRLASTASRSCTQRAAEAPAVAADRSLSGRCRLRCSRPAEPGLLRAAARAWCRWSPRCCAGPPALQPGGQRSHRTTEDRGSRQSAAMRARLARPYRRRRAPVPPVSRGRPLGLLRQSALLARILGCRLCRRVP